MYKGFNILSVLHGTFLNLLSKQERRGYDGERTWYNIEGLSETFCRFVQTDELASNCQPLYFAVEFCYHRPKRCLLTF